MNGSPKHFDAPRVFISPRHNQDEAGKAQATAKATTCFLRPFFALETLTLPVKDAGLMTPEALHATFESAFPGRK